jgi:AbrB family looped-hinge helix DNA binding protein
LTDGYRPGKVRQRKIAEAVIAYNTDRKEEPLLSTISSKNQITLPIQLLREIGLGPGDRLAVIREGNKLILRARPKNWVEYYSGSLKGLYGNSREEIDEYIADQRDDEGHRDAQIEEAWNGKRPAAEE